MIKKLSTILPFIVLVITSFQASAQETDYTKYHESINQAEHLYFMEQRYDEAFEIFDNVFDSFDFVFLKDCVNAAQLAYVRGKPYKKYIYKGFENGLKLSMFEFKQRPSKFLQNMKKELDADPQSALEYQNRRPKYLARINKKMLSYIMDEFFTDQVNKNKPDREYNPYKKKVIDNIIALINEEGFPGSRLVGVQDATVFKDLGHPNQDFYFRRDKTKFKGDKWMVIDEDLLTTQYVIVLLLHNPCAYQILDDLLLGEVKKGNIHPREVGLLYDNLYRFGKPYHKLECRKYDSRVDGWFNLNLFADHIVLSYDKTYTNQLRASWHITPLELDQKKKEFAVEHEMKLFWGFWGCM
jgi:hypothetical protein